MKIIFIGTVAFSLSALEKLIELNAEIVGIITKKSSKFNSDFTDLTPICFNAGLDVRFTDNINSAEDIQWIKNRDPDVILCFGWSALIKRRLLQIPKIGVIGYHPALLPLNRGRHPIIWALVLGLEQTGSTFFIMDEGADSGDIVHQEAVAITYKDNAQSLYEKLVQTALRQLDDIYPKLLAGTVSPTTQNDSIANYWRKRSKVDGKIDFRMSSRAVYNLVRALSKPYPGAHLEFKGREIKIWKASELLNFDKNIEPGKVIAVSGRQLHVKCGENAIAILEHDFDCLPSEGEYIF